ncbi:TRAP transporter large permease [Planktotalea arctica]|uniref:TRAP transporter large permease n=1 Tax=Planktotalea arctica TaxID=1481893 RepID=UPI00321C03AB
MIWLLLIILAVLVLLEVPVAFALPASALMYLFVSDGIPPMLVVQRVASGLESYVLLAIPLFIFAGNLFNSAGIAARIFDFAVACVGHIRGSLGHVNIVASVIFSGMSGVAQADAAGLGAVEVREMKRHGFSPEFSAAITAVSSIIGPIIPPSGIMIIYAVLADVSVPDLFLAGIVPGVLMSLCLMAVVYWLARTNRIVAPVVSRKTPKEIRVVFWRALPALIAPVFLIAGILTGFATPTQLGALTAIYAIILGFATRDLTLEFLWISIKDTVVTCGVLVFIIAAATPFSAILALEGVPQQLADLLLSISDNPLVVLLIVNIALLIFGMIMDTTAILLVAVPVLVPVMTTLGVDPVHFGIIMVINLLIGTLTPPFGILLFVMTEVAKVEYKPLLRETMPFFIPLFGFLILITYWPALSLSLPAYVFGR